MMSENGMKVCSKCASRKAKSEFKTRKSSSDGLHQWCSTCLATYYREYERRNAEKKSLQRRKRYEKNKAQILADRAKYYKKNIETIKARKSAYRIANRELLRDANRVWRKDNAEYLKLAKREWRKDNAEYLKLAHREWAKANHGVVRSIRARRRAAELKATPSWVSRTEIDAIYTKAARIQMETGIKYHVDHIVPLQGKSVNGLHVPWNLQIIPATENLSKGNRL